MTKQNLNKNELSKCSLLISFHFYLHCSRSVNLSCRHAVIIPKTLLEAGYISQLYCFITSFFCETGH